MSTETAMNAYVLLPNALHLLLHSPEFDFEKHVGATKDQVEAATENLLATKPTEIVEYLQNLPKSERDILHRALLVCLRALDEYAFEQRLGLPKEAGGEVLEILRTADEASRTDRASEKDNA